jgi:hypothetical protein
MKTDWDYIEYWCLLFEQEKTFCGVVRQVFDQSFQRLTGLCYWVTSPHRNDPNLLENTVRELMMARLPLYLGSLTEKELTIKDLQKDFDVLVRGEKVGKHLLDALYLCCGCLRLDPEATDEMKKRILT